MNTIRIKPLSQMTLEELLLSYGRIMTAQAWCERSTGPEYADHSVVAEPIIGEVRRRDMLNRDGAMFAPKMINREDDGDILFA